MKKIFPTILILTLTIIPLIVPVTVKPISAAEPKLVFATYIQGMPTYGNKESDFKKEILEAQNLGIDGFIYYINTWRLGADPAIFRAADETNFKIIVGITNSGNIVDPEEGPSLIIDLIKTAIQHTSYYKYHNQPLVVTWKGDDKDQEFWETRILEPLKQQGINILFLPYFTIQNNSLPIEDWHWPNWFGTLADGFNYFGASRLPATSITYGQLQAEYMQKLNKYYMAGVSPYYFRTRHSAMTRDYSEYDGGEGIAAQWDSIINIQKPLWVNIVTWNDFTESYISPADPDNPALLPICTTWCQQTKPLLKSHLGYAELMKYYISWYKSGVQPTAVYDSLYYFYRTHPKDLVASNEPNDVKTHGIHGNSISDPDGKHENILDLIYVTTILKSPATLKITSGGQETALAVDKGIQHHRIPFRPGNQIFRLYRNDSLILEKQGDSILSTISTYNFIPTTGYIHIATPGDLNSDGHVDIFDYNLFVAEYGKTGYSSADLNKDSEVNLFDYNLFVANYGHTGL